MPPGLQNWHLDKRVPISIIGAIALQTLGLGWYASKLDSRVSQLEETGRRDDASEIARNVVVDARLEALRADRDRLVRIEAQLEYVTASIRRLEQKIDGNTGGGR